MNSGTNTPSIRLPDEVPTLFTACTKAGSLKSPKDFDRCGTNSANDTNDLSETVNKKVTAPETPSTYSYKDGTAVNDSPEQYEEARLRTLEDYRILDTPLDLRFEQITELAALGFKPPAGGTSDQKEQRCRLKMVISYDGSDFAGFQYQSPPARTVQATVEKAAWRIFGADAGRVVGASRTDGGVHAKAAVAHLDVPTQPSLAELDAALVGINLCLPPDVRIRKIEVAPDGFQAQRGSAGKIYHYLLATTCPPTPSESRFRFWTVPLWCAVNRKRPARLSDGALDVEAMRAAAEMIQGRRDFSALTEAKRPSGMLAAFSHPEHTRLSTVT
ncbi:hypothetical protein CYMTET_15469 [Cymbomonas tetramitiformis]|uniref:tRNA pseudouridine synthase n=1 Tax=Cymbomonas tetramitiformis TaxID=36881 RepID=A0AAE0L945_9CHLO|nr:hypothetical protein CYMTET_15469 [Cymbomonas tetramitiformis]